MYVPYAPHDTLIEPARKSAAIWRIIVGAVVIWFGSFLLIGGVIAVMTSGMTEPEYNDFFNSFFVAATPASALGNLAIFACYTAVLFLVLQVLHNRSILSLIGPPVLALRQAVRVMLYLLPLYLLILVMPVAPEFTLERNLPVLTWLMILPLLLPLILLQSGTEELVFRGYFQSQLAATINHPAVWLLIPSLAFGILHWANGDTDYAAAGYVTLMFFIGLTAGDVTARAGTLGPALAMHFTNNAFAIGVFAYDDWLYGASLWVTPLNGAPWVPNWGPDLMFILVTWLAARLAIRA